MIICFVYAGLELLLLLCCLASGNIFGENYDNTVVVDNSGNVPLTNDFGKSYYNQQKRRRKKDNELKSGAVIKPSPYRDYDQVIVNGNQI